MRAGEVPCGGYFKWAGHEKLCRLEPAFPTEWVLAVVADGHTLVKIRPDAEVVKIEADIRRYSDPNYQPGGIWSGGPGMPYGT